MQTTIKKLSPTNNNKYFENMSMCFKILFCVNKPIKIFCANLLFDQLKTE